jgi:hypothetical protein
MDAVARCDTAAIADGMAEGCLRYGEPEWLVIAKAPYIEAYRQFLRSFSDYRLEIVNTVASGRTVAFEMIESARFTGAYPLPDGRTVQPSGQTYTDRVCTWIEVDDDGKVAEIRAYVPSTRGRLMAEAMAATP